MPGGLSPKPATEADLINDKGGIPEGFTPIFNGKDLTGWHISKTNHHGTTPDYRVLHGIIIGNQQPDRTGRHPADRQAVQELRGLHGGQAGLGQRQRFVPALE